MKNFKKKSRPADFRNYRESQFTEEEGEINNPDDDRQSQSGEKEHRGRKSN